VATEVIKTIRAVGGDYSTLEGWNDGEARNLLEEEVIAVGEMYHDWPNGFDGVLHTTNAWGSNETYYPILRPAPGHKHNGRYFVSGTSGALTGAGIRSTGAGAIQVHYSYMRIVDMIVICDTPSQNSLLLISIGSKAIGCLCKNSPDGFTGSAISVSNISGRAINCVAWNSFYGITLTGGGSGTGNEAVAFNCTAVGCKGVGIGNGNTGQKLINCLAHGTTDGPDIVPGLEGEVFFCATSDDSDLPPGQGNRTEQEFNFVDPANLNFRLAEDDTGARGYGQDLSANSYLPFDVDIMGNPRGVAWDIGAFQYHDEPDVIENLVVDDATPSVTAHTDVGDVHFVTVEYEAEIDRVDLENLIEHGIPE